MSIVYDNDDVEVSSRRFKTDIVDAKDYGNDVERLRIVNFRYIGSTDISVGLIAEEVQNIIPELVVYDSETGLPRTVQYTMLIPILVQTVQRMRRNEEELKDRIDLLNDRIDKLISSLINLRLV